MLKNGRYCIYNGKEYHVENLGHQRVNIYTKNKDIIDKTFHTYKDYYEKEIQYGEVEEAYDIIPRAVVGSRKIPVSWEQDDRYILRTDETDDAEIIEKCHLVWVDRGEMEGWISKDQTEVKLFRRDLNYYGDWKKKAGRESEGYDKEYEIM